MESNIELLFCVSKQKASQQLNQETYTVMWNIKYVFWQ